MAAPTSNDLLIAGKTYVTSTFPLRQLILSFTEKIPPLYLWIAEFKPQSTDSAIADESAAEKLACSLPGINEFNLVSAIGAFTITTLLQDPGGNSPGLVEIHEATEVQIRTWFEQIDTAHTDIVVGNLQTIKTQRCAIEEVLDENGRREPNPNSRLYYFTFRLPS